MFQHIHLAALNSRFCVLPRVTGDLLNASGTGERVLRGGGHFQQRRDFCGRRGADMVTRWRQGLLFSGELVAEAAYSQNAGGIVFVGFNFAAQAADVDGQGFDAFFGRVAPDLLEQPGLV